MNPQSPILIVRDAAVEAQHRHRWMLLSGFFVLISTVFPFVITMPDQVQPAIVILLALSVLAFAAYNIAIRRYWVIALGLSLVFLAAMGWIVAR